MRLRDSIALTLPSFFLRLVLGITFLWAGTGKLMGTMQASGDDAARLANMGVVLDPVTPPALAEPQVDDPELVDPEPTSPLPDLTDEPEKQLDAIEDGVEDTMTDLQEQANEVIKKIEEATESPAPPPASTTDEPTSETGTEKMGTETIGTVRHHEPMFVRVQNTTGDRAASDFPDPMACQRLYSIALMISKAADPGLTEDSQPITPIMPTKLATGNWPKLMAWAAAITELVAGGLLILGLLTRLSALSTLTVMLVAMWMTQFGPAAFHSSDAILGFIPRADDLFSPAAYGQLLWQLALASMSLAVVFLGSGAIGLDRLIFSSHPRDPYLHGDPKAGKKQTMNPASAQRTEFDRSPPSAG
ncbi:MAG: DoxX family membrane protein [Phycisphaerales bacterium JB052]